MRRLVAVAMGALAPFAVAGAALAAKPVIETERLDETDTIDCGTFTLEDHVFGTIKHRVYTDRAGNVVRELHTISLRHVTTNPTTGESITTRDVGADRVQIFPDGSAIVQVIGLVGRIVVPGRGVVAADVGRLVLFFEGPEDQEPDVLFESGRHDDLEAAVCEVLAP
jgi:hypothetical protein